MAPRRLNADSVYHACDAGLFSFNTTADIEPLEELSEALAQPRAVESLRFGTGMPRHGFNIFALGTPGTGRHSMVRQTLDKKAKQTLYRLTGVMSIIFRTQAARKLWNLPPAGAG